MSDSSDSWDLEAPIKKKTSSSSKISKKSSQRSIHVSKKSNSQLDFIDSFLEHIDEKKRISSKQQKSETDQTIPSGPKFALDKPVLPSLTINRSTKFETNEADCTDDINNQCQLAARSLVEFKRKSQMQTFHTYDQANTDDLSSGTDSEEEDDEIIKKLAARATMKRRPTIALALMSSSSGESEPEEDEEEENLDNFGPATLDLDYLKSITQAHRNISKVSALQFEFPDISLEVEPEEENKEEEKKGFKKFKKIGTSIKMVAALSSKVIPEATFERDSVDPSKMSRSRRVALTTHSDVNEETAMRRQVEKTLTEKTHLFVLHPHSSFRFYWDIVSIVILMINVVTIPLELSFYLSKTNEALSKIKMITDVWFILDIMLNFRTGIFQYHIRKVLEMDPTEIRRSYIRGWFFIDLIATFPFDVMITLILPNDSGIDIAQKTKYLKMGRVLKILALLRILRLARFVRYLHQWEDHLNMDYGFAENMMKSFNWTFILLMVGHWNACILFLIPSQSTSDLEKEAGYGPAESLVMSWIFITGVAKEDAMPSSEMYIRSLFKSLSHMLSIGYGCNTPNIAEDMWATVFVLFVGCLVFALFLSQMISLIDQMNMGEKIFKRHLQEVDDYLRFNRTPVPLKRAVKDYYEYHYKQRIFNENQILAELNPILYEEVVTCGIINYIKDCEFFRTCREELQRKLCHLFKVEMYQPYTNIQMAGRVAQSFAIIRAGVVACENEELSRRGKMYHLGEGDHFGLESFATIVNPRSVTTVMSESWVEVVQIKTRDLREFTNKQPEYADEINLIIALANESLKRTGQYAKIIGKQRDAKLYYG